MNSASALLVPKAGNARTPPKTLFSNRLWETEKIPVSAVKEWMAKDYATREDNAYFGNGWKHFTTPLASYSYGPLKQPGGAKYVETFRDYLGELAALYPNPKIVDVGIGRGAQWLGFIRRNPHVEFGATALTPKTVVPDCRPFVKRSMAGDIWRHYDPSSLDLISTHWGTYRQTLSLIENAMLLLKPGGDIIISQQVRYFLFHDLMAALAPLDGKVFRILSSIEDNAYEHWNENAGTYYDCTIQLCKIADP